MDAHMNACLKPQYSSTSSPREAANEDECDRALANRWTKAQAREALESLPPDLIMTACRGLMAGAWSVDVDGVLHQAYAQPHQALALIEQAMPAYLTRLTDIEAQARASHARMRKIQMDLFGV